MGCRFYKRGRTGGQGGRGFVTLMRGIAAVILAGLATGCMQSRVLVDAPTLYVSQGTYPDAELPAQLRTTQAELFFVTDRLAQRSSEKLSYSADRSASMALGVVDVEYGSDVSWEELKAASASARRDRSIPLRVTDVEEIVRFPETPLPFHSVNGRLVALDGPAREYRAAQAAFVAAIRSRLRDAPRKEIFLFVHGFNNDFDDAALSLADVWHFSGRVGVPIFYTWPAGNGGLFGYFKDRESGEYTVFHLKEFLRTLSLIDEVEAVHILAHSRGTDVTTTALRELVIELRAKGQDPRHVLKVENLIMAAPDLDFGIVRQRLMAERFGPAIGQITVYMNQGDSALGLSQRLMAGQRFGRLGVEDLGSGERAIFSRIRNVNFIDVESQTDGIGHGYYRRNPEVLSDITIAVRERARPGTPQRPLEPIEINFWRLPAGYPQQRTVAVQ